MLMHSEHHRRTTNAPMHVAAETGSRESANTERRAERVSRCLQAAVVIAMLALASPFTAEQTHAQDAPVAWTAEDQSLEWGPCPAFMPETCEIAVLNGDPSEANADIFFKLASGTTAPTHRHTSAERMVLVSGEMHVEYEGHEPTVLEPGSYAYGPPEHPHEARCAEGEDCVLFIAFEHPIDAEAVDYR